MPEASLELNLPPGASGTVVFTGGGKSKVAQFLPDVRAGFEVVAVCGRCEQPLDTGQRVGADDLPLRRLGSWRHSCGGTAHMPDEYEVNDRRTGRSIDAYTQAREQVVLSAVTLAELLRLSQAARAVQDGREGAEERLDRALAEAPEPIRRLRDRFGLHGWTREQKLALAGIIVTLVTALVPILKDDGAVTERQLVEVIEKAIDQGSDAPSEHAEPENDAARRAGHAGASESGGPADAPQGGGNGGAAKVQHDQGVGHPDQ